MNIIQTLGLALGAGFSSGLNLYAAVATLGLLQRFGVIHLPESLHALAHPWVLGIAIALYLVEFFADKIPVFDLLWNALHTFVRVPVAGLLAYQATRQLSPEQQLLATLLGAVVAFAAHGGKTAARAAVTPSPEPLSNITLSVVEDVLAVGLTWLATRHPYVAGALATVFVAIIFVSVRFVIRALRALFRGAEASLLNS